MRNAFLAASLIAMLLLAACSSGGDSASPSVTVSPRPTRTPTRTPTATRTATPTPIPTPLPSSDPLTAPFELPVLMYHDVSDTPPNDIYRAPLNVKPDVFSTQLDYLECAGYTAITPSRMAEAIAGRGALPPKPVILTFDDGYADQYTDAFPILERHGMTGAFSIITGYVEADGEYMTWSQIETMAGAGMEMMSHTVTHVDLNVADDATALGQLRDSRLAITAHTGRAPAFLVYPSGEPFRSGTAERQAQIISMAAAAGYSGAFLAGPASTTQDPSHPFQFNRFRVDRSTDLATFAATVGGPPPADCPEVATPATGPAYGRGSATSE